MDVAEGAQVDLNGSGSDPDGDPISFSWIQIAGDPVSLTDVQANSASFTAPSTDVNIELTFQLTVTDINGAAASDDIVVRVTNNDAPTANAGANQNVDELTEVALDGSGSSDPNGAIASYLWTQVSGPVALLDDAAIAEPLFTAPVVNATTALEFELTVTDESGSADTDNVFVTVAPVPTGPIPLDADRFLAFLNSSSPLYRENQASADAYYAAVDPLNEKTTLDDWKSANGFDQGNDARAIYRNSADLGFGRVMHIRANADGSVAAFVENYESLELAIDAEESGSRDNLLATVAMEFSEHPDDPGGEKYTKFYTFDGDDQRVTRIDLDGRGEKYQPGLCVVCHGGRPKALVNGVYPDNGDTGAHFLPWDLETFEFSNNPLFTRAAQEDQLKELNRIALLGHPDPSAAEDGAWDGDATRELIEGWYGDAGADMPAQEFDPDFVPVGWRAPANGGPAGNPANVEELYLRVIGPNCRACHIQRGVYYEATPQGEYVDFTTYSRFMQYREETIEAVYDDGTMPNALVTFEQFWTETDGVVPAELLGVHLGVNATVRRPGRPLADPGPSREAPIGPVQLSAEASRFAETFEWTFAPVNGRPPTSQATITGGNTIRPILNTDVAGGYRLQLVVSDGITDSEPVTTTITTFDAIDARSFAQDIEPIFDADCVACHSVGQEMSIPGIRALFDDPATRYDVIIGYVNFDDVAASPILTKPSGRQHGAGAEPREGFDLSGGLANKDSYDALVQWIAEGALDN